MGASLALIEDSPAADERVIALRGEIDVGSTPALREWLGRASEGGTRSVTVDFTHVEFLAVSGLYVLCDEQARLSRHLARLTLVCTNDRILKLLDVCRLADVLRVVPSRAALAAACGPATTTRAPSASRPGSGATRRADRRRDSRRARSRAVRRDRRPGVGARTPLEQGGEAVELALAGGDLEHRADERAVHVTHERVGGDPELEQVAEDRATPRCRRRARSARDRSPWA
jgi:anti-sigma B factor antagonist